MQEFKNACARGDLLKAQNILSNNPNQWLLYLASIIPDGMGGVEAKEGGINISAENECAFRIACQKGHLEVVIWLLQLRPDKYFKNKIRTKEDQLWYKIQYLMELSENKKHKLYKLSLDMICQITFYI